MAVTPKQKLAPYRAKRDFTRTAEPSGAKTVAAGKATEFSSNCHDLPGTC